MKTVSAFVTHARWREDCFWPGMLGSKPRMAKWQSQFCSKLRTAKGFSTNILKPVKNNMLEFQEAVRACAMRPISGFKVHSLSLLFFGVFCLYPILFCSHTRTCIIATHPFVLWRDQGQPEIISFILSRWCDLANEYAYRFDFNITSWEELNSFYVPMLVTPGLYWKYKWSSTFTQDKLISIMEWSREAGTWCCNQSQ